MKTSQFIATVITLSSTAVFLSGCGDEQKEASTQVERALSGSESTQPAVLSDVTDKASELADKTGEALENISEQAVEKTTEVTQDFMDSAESTTVQAVETVKEAVSEATKVVNTTPGLVREIQQALLDKGYNPGSVDGVVGRNTRAALEAFQKQNNLSVGQITSETLQALGIAN